MSGKKGEKLLSNLALQLALPASRGANWEVACAIALDSSLNTPLKDRTNLQKVYNDITRIIQPLIEQASGLPAPKHNEVIICDRHEWIVRMGESLPATFGDIISTFWDFLEKRNASKLTKKFTATMVTTEIGLLLGFLSTKVLGQYDLGIPTRDSDDFLFIVEPNVVFKEEMLNLKRLPFRFWILAHELTHKWQFEHFVWLKDYYYELINEFGEIVTEQVKDSQVDKKQPLNSLSLLFNKANWDLIAKTQSFMSFIEGYADFVMFSVGKKLAGYEQLEDVFSHRKQSNTNIMKRVLEKIIGLDLKTSQYRQGLAFVAQISKLKSLMFLNEQMDSPEKLPSLKELASPQSWIKRIASK